MKDVKEILDEAQEKMDIEASEKSAERMMNGQFTLDDMLIQLQQVSKMGPISGLLKMLPGANQMANQIEWVKIFSHFFFQRIKENTLFF